MRVKRDLLNSANALVVWMFKKRIYLLIQFDITLLQHIHRLVTVVSHFHNLFQLVLHQVNLPLVETAYPMVNMIQVINKEDRVT